ncbi:MAG: glycerophosphodiester phosphodiesterase [Actinomycetota bacterium]
MLVVGHRGARAHEPENTLASFERALSDGADGIEFDVVLTADHVPVISHDDLLARTCGSNQRISALSVTELRSLNEATAAIPTLEEVLEAFAGRTRLFVELKAVLDSARGFISSAEVAERSVDLLQGVPDLVVSSFDPSGPAIARRAGLPIAHGVVAEASCTPFVTSARDAGCVQIHPIASMVDDPLIEAAHAVGLEVICWTVDDPHEAERFAAMGVDGIFSDDPAAVVRR